MRHYLNPYGKYRFDIAQNQSRQGLRPLRQLQRQNSRLHFLCSKEFSLSVVFVPLLRKGEAGSGLETENGS